MRLTVASKVVPQSVKQLINLILSNRGIKDAEVFLHPASPLNLRPKDVGISSRQMAKAVERLAKAKAKQEKIIVFGDYDCDGVCASAVLWETLHEFGCQVLPYIPDRQKHGYGLSKKAIDEILAAGKPDILISVDNGITAVSQWQRLKKAGVYTILTDHHEIGKEKPKVDVLLHTTDLCGTTVAWMLAREINAAKAGLMLDLCALATIADQVPLIGANRQFAQHGLKALNATKRLGLELLIAASGLEQGEIDSYSVNFGLVPRINAMGRLGAALDALRALCTKNKLRATQLVSKLSQTNSERQELTKELVDLARSRAKEWQDENVIVIEDVRFHEGVIGLIAGRLTEEFHKPSIVISVGEVTSKASARSIPGVHITSLLREVSSWLLDVGGHPLATGFSIETIKITDFKQFFKEKARDSIASPLLEPTAQAECELPVALVTLATAQTLKQLEPYGQRNREPMFLLKDVRLERLRTVGKEGKHLSFRVALGENKVSAVAFGQGGRVSELHPEVKVSLVTTLDVNAWQGKTSVQLKVKQIIQTHSAKTSSSPH